MKRGFTLVELLVVISLLLLLTLITVSALDSSIWKSEEVRSASNMVQAVIQGAQDRAVYHGKVTGRTVAVRFHLDDAEDVNGVRRQVSSMSYLLEQEPWREGSIVLLREDKVDNATGAQSPDGIADGPEIVKVRGFETGWYDLWRRGLISEGSSQIRIPAGDHGTYYTVVIEQMTPTFQEFRFLTPYATPANTPPTAVVGFTPTPDYELPLPMVAMPNSEPVTLPQGTVIDLKLSRVPRPWFNGSQPWPPTWTTGGAYASEMDLIFDGNGSLTGEESASGVIHLWMRNQTAVDLDLPPLHEETVQNSVTTIWRTGTTGSSPLDIEDGNGDLFPDDPFKYAETGR